MKKIDHVLLFCEKMLDFEKRHPVIFSMYILKKIPRALYKTPFDRDARLNNPVVQEMREKYWKAIMKKMYMLDWEFVKVISYDSIFIEYLNIVDDAYETVYNILWDDIIYTEFMIPKFMVKYNCQKHLYLKKKEEVISFTPLNLSENDSIE